MNMIQKYIFFYTMITNNDSVIAAAPFWISRPRDKVARIGESATFTCEASGIPSPITRWLINGRPISGK